VLYSSRGMHKFSICCICGIRCFWSSPSSPSHPLLPRFSKDERPDGNAVSEAAFALASCLEKAFSSGIGLRQAAAADARRQWHVFPKYRLFLAGGVESLLHPLFFFLKKKPRRAEIFSRAKGIAQPCSEPGRGWPPAKPSLAAACALHTSSKNSPGALLQKRPPTQKKRFGQCVVFIIVKRWSLEGVPPALPRRGPFVRLCLRRAVINAEKHFRTSCGGSGLIQRLVMGWRGYSLSVTRCLGSAVAET